MHPLICISRLMHESCIRREINRQGGDGFSVPFTSRKARRESLSLTVLLG
jgi:hypothetical protein